MSLGEKISLVSLLVCSVLVATSFGKTIRDLNTGNDGLIRAKRGGKFHFIGKPALDGIAAVKKLLRGARTMEPEDAGFKLYSKLGSYDKALKDFNRVRPKSKTDLQGPNGEQIRTGVKGDREIILTKADAKQPNSATIEIKKLWELNGEKTGRTTHKIVYQ